MRVAVINEISAYAKNPDILSALSEIEGVSVLNVGMTRPDEEPVLTYIHTGLMAGLLLNAGACDLVVGGCGTGQGFLNSAMQYPGVFCGLILNPLDAWLFSKINGGNCVSLALNKGYGWAGDINLRHIFRELFRDPPGSGYPPARAASQQESREALRRVSEAAHRPMEEILAALDPSILETVGSSERFLAAFGRKLP